MLGAVRVNQFQQSAGRRAAATVAALLSLLLLAGSVFGERLPIKTYTVADGLLRDHINRIRQDSRGFLWFCTADGVSRFDGAGMTNFTLADGLPNRYVADFLETRNGTIYLATGKGLARLNPHGRRGSREDPLFTVFLPENSKSESIQTLFEDASARIWVGTSDGLYRLEETDGTAVFEEVPLGRPIESGGAIAEPGPDALSVVSIVADRHGALWVGTFGGGLFRLGANGSRRRLTRGDGLGDNKITALFEARDGRLWVGLRSDEGGGVCLLDPADEKKPVEVCYRTKDGLPANWVRSMLETGDGRIWLATARGLCEWQPEAARGALVCKTYTAKNDLCDEVLVLAEDREGNLWTGSPCGAQKIARYGFTAYDAADGLAHAAVDSIFEDAAGALYVSSNQRAGVVARFEGDRFSPVKPVFPEYVDYFGWGWQQTVRRDRRGAWWIPTGYGLFRSPDETSFDELGRARLEKQETGARGAEVFRLFEDSRGDVWALTTGAANELLRWEREKNVWHDYTEKVGFSLARVGSAIAEDLAGNIWIGASSDHQQSALIRYRRGEFRVLTEACDGDECAPSGWIRDLYLDGRGRLWIASTNDGVWRLDDPTADDFEFVKYTTADGLSGNAAASLTEDEFGRIYIGTWRGIDRLTPETGQIENFTTAEGLPGSFVENAYRDRRNHLWFGTHQGLARYVPEPPRARRAPTMLVTALRVEGEPQRVSILGETELKAIELDSHERQVSVDFLGLGVSLGEKLTYEYRLNETDWTETAQRTVDFANLASGDYRFEVRARTAASDFSRPATVAFRIAAPVWQRWWFVLSVLALAALAVYLIYRDRLRRLLEIERTRTRIATDLHDDIGSNLTKISIMSEVARRLEGEKQGELLNAIADISRSSVSSMSDIVWAINPQKDSFLELVRRMRALAEDVPEQKDVRVEFRAPETFGEIKLDADVRRNVFLIFKETLNNIVRHANASTVTIELEILHRELRLTVADDGPGFDAERETEGNGLPNMKRRAALLGGELKIRTAPYAGTEIVLRLPI